MKFRVELDFSAMFSTDIDADSAREAYDKAVESLNDEVVSVRSIDSFQVFDERMRPCDLREDRDA